MKLSAIPLALIVCLSAFAQQKKPGASVEISYGGTLLSLQENKARVCYVDKLKGISGEGYQGMEVYGDTVLSAQNSGWLSVYTYNGEQLKQIVAPYKMDCYDKVNHSNVVSLSNYRYEKSDPLPLLYVSQCARQPWRGMKDVLFVERIAPDLKSTQTVQTIYFKDTAHLFGYALQWVVDRDNDMLYGYGNTIDNENKANKHRIVKFRLPKWNEGENGLLVLTEADLLENYLLEDTYNCPFMPIGQGLFVHRGQLFMPTGFGSADHPSVLYVWNLQTRSMQNVIDLSRSTFSELEDCALWRGSLLLQAQGHLFSLTNL